MVDCLVTGLVMNFLSCRDGKLWNVSPSVYNKNESVLRSISLWLCKRAYRVRGRSGALVGWDGCEVRLCARVPVCVPAPPGVFLPGTRGHGIISSESAAGSGWLRACGC